MNLLLIRKELNKVIIELNSFLQKNGRFIS